MDIYFLGFGGVCCVSVQIIINNLLVFVLSLTKISFQIPFTRFKPNLSEIFMLIGMLLKFMIECKNCVFILFSCRQQMAKHVLKVFHL